MPDTRSDGSHIANAALIVEAVNAYDRLRAIEAAARDVMEYEYDGSTEFGNAMHALRSLLSSEVPSDAR